MGISLIEMLVALGLGIGVSALLISMLATQMLYFKDRVQTNQQTVAELELRRVLPRLVWAAGYTAPGLVQPRAADGWLSGERGVSEYLPQVRQPDTDFLRIKGGAGTLCGVGGAVTPVDLYVNRAHELLCASGAEQEVIAGNIVEFRVGYGVDEDGDTRGDSIKPTPSGNVIAVHYCIAISVPPLSESTSSTSCDTGTVQVGGPRVVQVFATLRNPPR